MKETLKFSLAILALLYTLTAFSQKRGYEPGYIINIDGDTIHGSIKDRTPEPFVDLFEQIRFKANDKGKKQKLGPSEIQEYSVRGSVYRSVAFQENRTALKIRYEITDDSPSHFLKLIRESEKLIYYELEFTDGESSYPDAMPLFYKPGAGEIVRATQGILGPKKKLLSLYFEDCVGLVDELNKRKSSLRSALDVYEFYLRECGED